MDVLIYHYKYKKGKMVKVPVWGSTKATNFKLTSTEW